MSFKHFLFSAAVYVGSLFFLLANVSALPKLAKTRSIKAVYSANSNRLHVTWNPIPGALTYKLSLSDQSGTLLSSKRTKKSMVKFSPNQLSEGQHYLVDLQALKTQQYSASSVTTKSFQFTTRVPTEEFYGGIKTKNSVGKSGMLFLPKNYRLKALPAMVLIHGSSTHPKEIADVFKSSAQNRSYIIIAPDSVEHVAWSFSRDLNTPTEDQAHINNSLQELYSLPHISISKLLIAGHSAGGFLAAHFGSNDSRYNSFADLHGGIDIESIGPNKVPVWLSTGSKDTVLPSHYVKEYQSTLQSLGFSDITFKEYSNAHGITSPEKQALISWWLD